jgi:hypothetical protein
MQFSRAHLGAGAAIVLVAGLTGCNNNSDGRLALTGSSYCTPFRTASNAPSNTTGLATPAAGDAASAFDDCVHRWAYAMAPARDPADIVAHAVVDACGEAMNAWNQQAAPPQNLSQSPNGQDQAYQNGPDQGAGGPQGYGPPPSRGRGGAPDQQMQMQQAQNSPIAQHMQIAEARSLFYVIQARSAGCAPPPANTLASRPAA